MRRSWILVVVILVWILGSWALWTNTYHIPVELPVEPPVEPIRYQSPPVKKPASYLEAFTSATTKVFDFTTPNPSSQLNDTCAVYYTSNVDICKRPFPAEAINAAMIDQNSLNYYRLGKTEIQSHINRLELLGSGRSQSQNDTLRDLKRAINDIDTFPFENTCKLDMYGYNELRSHPYKINTDYDRERRGNPSHWAFCFYPENVGRTEISVRQEKALQTEPVFTRVFEDSGAELLSSNVGTAPTRYHRFDMKSLYNDDLLNLHCRLYENSAISGGNGIAAYNNTRLIEITLPTSIPSTGRIPISRMRMVRIQDAKLFVETDFMEIKRGFLSLAEVLRTQQMFLQRIKNYTPTIYKILFHLCDATQQTTVGETTAPMAHTKYLELIIPKITSFAMPALLKTVQTNETIYDFYNQRPFGDISDMRFNITDIDRCVPNTIGDVNTVTAQSISCPNSS